MKNILLIIATSCIAMSCYGSTKADAPTDVGASQPESVYIVDAPAASFEYTATLGSDFIGTSYRLDQPGTLAYEFHFSPVRKYWNVIWKMGTPDSKRHFKWQFFQRKLC